MAVWSAGLEPFMRRMAALASAEDWRRLLARAAGRLELGEAASFAGALLSAVLPWESAWEALALLAAAVVSVSFSL